MKISILTPDFSHNCFGRAWLLAKLLQKHYDIEVIGPAFGNGIWRPLRGFCDFNVRMVRGYNRGRFDLTRMLNMISSDVIYASKPVMASFAVGLLKKLRDRIPLVLDIDDWQLGLQMDYYRSLDCRNRLYYLSRSMLAPNSYQCNMVLDKLTGLADAKTVSGNVLKSKYGGRVIWHCRDTTAFNPHVVSKTILRDKYLPSIDYSSFIVSFIGSPRPQKGLEDLIDAILFLNKANIKLMIVGDDGSPYCERLKAWAAHPNLAGRVFFFNEQPFQNTPEFLAISDLVVIPQRQRAASYAQVPAKLFDAMAMAKPIISTKVSDIPEILAHCGWVVVPEDPIRLANAILYVYNHPHEAEEKGKMAREKCVKEFSWHAMEKRLLYLFRSLFPNHV